ncbi:TetR/AcrR family transcriptional regulator [Gordonia sp. HY002]|uniref:TetR/AcrR family transcriptional regulator n=1 Tax=Gordonia zhenghanii TaxID=2911516 RepID=UPI001EEFD790|nr:TetR/AcrR family transcriptional regulator [Gordonia zhenghanii]MCF8571626.1 TetR/AcrR family transcriptional regulator [Gordonia zhenghanii]MCF8602223.1 TetR/AcrR family transcriptional regulator [Gordonia zhenghanii]
MTVDRRTSRARAPHLGPGRRRPQILDAALEIASRDGISSVTMAAVASALDVTRPVVYAAYSGRSEILRALIEREEHYLGESLSSILRNRRVDATESVFVEGFQSLLEAVDARPQSWRLLYGNPDAEVTDLFGRGRAIVLARCCDLLRPTLDAWGTEDAVRKLPALVEFWVSSGEGAVRTLLESREAGDERWTPHDLGAFVGAAVYRGLRDA